MIKIIGRKTCKEKGVRYMLEQTLNHPAKISKGENR
jgi:hypothetical protein